jgi:hypothetical protein
MRAVAIAALRSFAVAMVEEACVFLVRILIRAIGFGTPAGGAGGEVMRVQEAQTLGLIIRCGVADQLDPR